jgi:hypothetical protein
MAGEVEGDEPCGADAVAHRLHVGDLGDGAGECDDRAGAAGEGERDQVVTSGGRSRVMGFMPASPPIRALAE